MKYGTTLPQLEVCAPFNHSVSDVIKKESKFTHCCAKPRRKTQESAEKP
jgi:hypothetical protein